MTLVYLQFAFQSRRSRGVIHFASRAAEDYVMKPFKRRETGEMNLSRSRLDQIIDMNDELANAVSVEAI